MLGKCGSFEGHDIDRTFSIIRSARFTLSIGMRLTVDARALV